MLQDKKRAIILQKNNEELKIYTCQTLLPFMESWLLNVFSKLIANVSDLHYITNTQKHGCAGGGRGSTFEETCF